MGKRGPSKGGAFERQVCRQLSRWWTYDERDDVFYRTATSGARATVRAKTGKQTVNQHGDVACMDPIGLPLLQMFTIEIKRGYSADTIQDLLDKAKGPCTLLKWIEQAHEASRLAGSVTWLLITKRDRRVPLVWLDDMWADQLALCKDGEWWLSYGGRVFGRWLGVVGIHLSDFFKTDPEDIRRCLRS